MVFLLTEVSEKAQDGKKRERHLVPLDKLFSRYTNGLTDFKKKRFLLSCGCDNSSFVPERVL